MPITFTFDVEQDSVLDANDRNRVVSCFKRLGWEHIGGSAWRYPALGSDNPSEDWFNHVIPALMYFRSLAIHANWTVKQFTLDAHSEAGFRSEGPIGAPIKKATDIETYALDDGKLSEARLKQFIQQASDGLGAGE